MTSRGCPYRCTYCCEASLKELYAGERFLRRRSPADCVAELVEAKHRFDLDEIVFEDEIFGMDLQWLSEFTPLYVQKVDLPLVAYIYPTRNVEQLLPLLRLAGLKFCCVALESGSAGINRTVFDRVFDRDLTLKTVSLCKQLGIAFYTDVITFNPYEEERDLRDTLSVLLDMGGRYQVCVNKLYVLPGTHLDERMSRDGVTAGGRAKDRLFHYYSRLFWIASFSPNPRWLIRLLEWLRIFRWRPALLHLGFVEWLLCGPIGKTIDALVRARRSRTEPREGRLRRLLEPPAPLIMNPAEPAGYRLGRWNLYLGGGGRYIGGFVNYDSTPALGVEVAGRSEQLPFRANVFQHVECDAILERVRRPDLVMREIERVLKPGGYAHLVASFCQPFQEVPNDYGRFTLDGLKQMAGGLHVIAEGWRTGPTATLLVFFIEYVKLLLPWRWWRVLAHGILGWLLFPLRYLDLLLLRSPHASRMGNRCFVWLRKPYGAPPQG
jgi:SAM-dependent methyltransferase